MTCRSHGPRIYQLGKKVIDLGADFRFRDTGVYETWYQVKHINPTLSEAVYGLPEINREKSRGPVVGNPGCYPTLPFWLYILD